MTKLSLVPEIAAYNGISFFDLIKWMLDNASTKDKKILFILFLLIIFDQ